MEETPTNTPDVFPKFGEAPPSPVLPQHPSQVKAVRAVDIMHQQFWTPLSVPAVLNLIDL